MIDLHVHSLLSDGELLPEEIVRRYEQKGYAAIALTDHAGPSNLEALIKVTVSFCNWVRTKGATKLLVIPGVELTYCPPSLIPELVKEARKMGARLILVHGETLVEPVAEGTNLAAIQGGADILAHPGLITHEEAKLAAQKGVLLEISARAGHCLANGHVAKMAYESGALMAYGSDAHGPEDILEVEGVLKVLRAAGLDEEVAKRTFLSMEELVKKCLGYQTS